MELSLRDRDITLRVGVVALLVLAALAVLLVVLGSADLHRGPRAIVYFRHAGALRAGADVQVAGRVIGRVVGIGLVPVHAAPSGHPLHPEGGVAVGIHIDDEYRHMAPINGEYFISNKGVFGERFVEIGPPPGNGPRERPIANGDQVRGVDPPEIDRLLFRTYRNLQNARAFAEAVRPEASELADSLRELSATLDAFDAGGAATETRVALGELIEQARVLDQAVRASGVSIDDIQRLWAEARRTAERVRLAADDLGARLALLSENLGVLAARLPVGAGDRLAAALAETRAALERAQRAAGMVSELIARVQRGEGTIGALLYDPEFPEHAKELGRIMKRQPWRIVGRPAPPR